MQNQQEETIKPSVGIVALGQQGIALTSFNDLVRFGEYLIQSGFTPNTIKTVPQAVIAIQTGLEVGLTPMAALSSIYVVNGRPTIWGDALPALAETRGGMTDMDEFFELNGVRMIDPPAKPVTGLKAVCVVTIRGTRKVRRVFEWEMAVYAGLDKKDGPWRTYPIRMLQMRARALAIRDGCPTALRGMPIKEEYETLGEPEERTVKDLLPGQVTVTDAPEKAPAPAEADKQLSAYERSIRAKQERAAKKAAKTAPPLPDGVTPTEDPRVFNLKTPPPSDPIPFELDPTPTDREPSDDTEFTIL
jgi:hypothetical protein